MSTIEDLEESLLRTFNSSEKESLSDIGSDDEERDKIRNAVSSSVSSDLNVDYSAFSNHVFFGSAYSAASFATERIISAFPLDGELKEKNEWRKTNSPYENWFFDNYPKQQGYLYLPSGSNSLYPYVQDHQGLLSPNSGTSNLGSYCVEMVVRPYAGAASGRVNGLYSYLNASNRGHFGYMENVAGTKSLVFKYIDDAGSSHTTRLTYDSYISSSHMVSYVWNSLINSGSIYIDGISVASSGTDIAFISASLSGAELRVGNYAGLNFSGNMDDFRYWTNFSTPRSEELIKKNYYRSIHANISGGLKLYWKFNQPEEYGAKVIDQSGNELHGVFTGAFSYATNIISGTLGDWFKDPGDPIVSLINSRVSDFVTVQQTSGSAFDDENQNLIFNLVPSTFTDDESDTEYQKLFLLLTARHFDRLKLYIDHLANVVKLQTEKYDGPPSNLLDLAAQHYGIDIGDVYTGADALQYYFGEDVYSSGSMQDSLSVVRNTLKRNIVSNLIYLIKTKSTQEAVKSVLRAVGLNDSVVSINEYTDFSGGISNTLSPKTVEQRVLTFLTSSNVSVDTTHFNMSSASMFQGRALFNTASIHLTQSLFTYELAGAAKFYGTVQRENLTSSLGRFILTALSSNLSPVSISSSIVPIFDNEWINYSAIKSGQSKFAFYVSSVDRSGIIFSSSVAQSKALDTTVAGAATLTLGTSGTNKFEGYMHEFRGWSAPTSDSTFLNYIDVTSGSMHYRLAHDWSLTEVPEIQNISYLKTHLRMNDYTGSTSGPIHNWVEGVDSSYSGLSSSADFNFPGKYITKFDVPLSYDLNVDNDKIRIKNQSTFTKNDQSVDIPFVSIDFSPITPLNKEIMRWIGDISQFANISADPLLDYKEENLNLRYLRQTIFSKRLNSHIDFSAFADLIQWFDNNFTYLLSQFIPLDLAYSISNYVIEPHVLENNKIKKFPSLGSVGRTTALEAVISTRQQLTASNPNGGTAFGDAGRFGAFASASADVSRDIYFLYSSSSNGINHGRNYETSLIANDLKNNVESWAPRNYGNAYYTTIITGANYLKNSLNVMDFNLTGVHYSGGATGKNLFMSSSHGEPGRSSASTASFNGVQDARWLWMLTRDSGTIENFMYDQVSQYSIPYRNRRAFQTDFGIGYGGMWGQLGAINKKSKIGVPKFISSSYDPVTGDNSGLGRWIGNFYQKSQLNFSNYIETFNDETLSTKILWPTKNSHNGVSLIFSGTKPARLTNGLVAAGVGETINIEKYGSVYIEIIGKTPEQINQSFSASFQLKFQFFSRETPGDSTFESVLSSSKDTANYNVSNIPVVYYLNTPVFNAPNGTVFSVGLQRKLPQQKYMRVYVNPVVSGSLDSVVSVCVRGIFSEKDIEDDSLPERKV